MQMKTSLMLGLAVVLVPLMVVPADGFQRTRRDGTPVGSTGRTFRNGAPVSPGGTTIYHHPFQQPYIYNVIPQGSTRIYSTPYGTDVYQSYRAINPYTGSSLLYTDYYNNYSSPYRGYGFGLYSRSMCIR